MDFYSCVRDLNLARNGFIGITLDQAVHDIYLRRRQVRHVIASTIWLVMLMVQQICQHCHRQNGFPKHYHLERLDQSFGRHEIP